MKRKTLSIILALALCMGLAIPALANNGEASPGDKRATSVYHDNYKLERLPDGSVKLVGEDYTVTIDKPVEVTTELFGSLTNTRYIIQLPLTGTTVTITVNDPSAFNYSDDTSWLGASEPGVIGWFWIYADVGEEYGDSLNGFYSGEGGAPEYYANTTGSAEWTSVWKSDKPSEIKEIIYGNVRFLYSFVDSPSVPALTATPTASTVLVNGKNIAFDAYNINGNNYFKLRDLAYILSGTQKQFDVGWDGTKNAISLTSGKAYTVAGGEMTGKGAGNKTPTPTSSKIYLDGKEVTFTAYNIDGNNYFKLRDIGEAFDFGVDWDGANNTIVIDTSKGYTPN